MSGLGSVAAIGAIGLCVYAMRAGGFVAARWVPRDSLAGRLLRLAPGNLFVAFGVAEAIDGGWIYGVGCIAAVATMAFTKREWAALGAGAGVVAVGTWLAAG